MLMNEDYYRYFILFLKKRFIFYYLILVGVYIEDDDIFGEIDFQDLFRQIVFYDVDIGYIIFFIKVVDGCLIFYDVLFAKKGYSVCI